MKTVLTATAFATLSFAAIADVPESDVVRCAAIVPDGERLACYDAVADKVSAAASIAATRRAAAAEAARKAEVEAAEAARKAAALAEARKVEQFGSETTPQRDALADEKLDALAAKVTEVFSDRYGNYLLMLDNGQLWKQIAGKLLTVRVGDDVTVKRGSLGSYRLKVVRQGRTVDAKRLK
jgi:hypothetical protein